MKKTFKLFLAIALIISNLFLVSSCSSLKITEQMQKSIDQYLAAVDKTQKRTSGKIKVESKLIDDAIEFKTTESVIDCEYQVKDGKVIFTRTDLVDGKESVKYKSDGKTVQVFDFDKNTWTDDTKNNENYLSAQTNPLTTLSLFRVDNNLKIQKNYLTDIKSREEDGMTVVEFTLKDSSISDLFSFRKADGIVRESAGHTRSYYINSEGYISKIIILTTQKITSNGKQGLYNTEMIVTC